MNTLTCDIRLVVVLSGESDLNSMIDILRDGDCPVLNGVDY